MDDELSLKWLMEAAKGGSYDAMYDLGDSYTYGIGVKRDLRLAREWYAKALLQVHVSDPSSLEVPELDYRGWVKPKQQTLEAVLGSEPMERIEMNLQLWAYFEAQGLHSRSNVRLINADHKLRPVFMCFKQLPFFKLRLLIDAQVMVVTNPHHRTASGPE